MPREEVVVEWLDPGRFRSRLMRHPDSNTLRLETTAPGQPTQNGHECFDTFFSKESARMLMEALAAWLHCQEMDEEKS